MEDNEGQQLADRNLLVAVIALQMNFIGRDALIRAMQQWIIDKSTRIEQIFVSNGDIGEKTQVLLTALVDQHLKHHAGSPTESLKTLSSVGDLEQDLRALADPDLEGSLTILTEPKPLTQENTVVWRAPSGSGRFRVVRPHKAGGLGAVSIAVDSELNREVALKEVRSEFVTNAQARERLRIEAEITGRLEHPGIVPVYSLGAHTDGSPFYCMRFIKGDSLKDAIKDYHEKSKQLSATDKNLALRELLRRFIDVCHAIAYAHSRKVLHRDLKPGNIMLGKYGETLVVDWGLAKAIGTAGRQTEVSEMPIVPTSGSTAAPTVAGSTIGTPQFMSPEQADGRIDELGPATDIYSLGASLYCLLTGQAPVSGDSTPDMLRKVRIGQIAPPRELNREIPKPLEAICLKAMQLEQSNRYDSADAMARDVERWLADEVVVAYREPVLSRVARSFRKNRTVATSVAVGVLVALAGLAAVNAIAWEKNRQIAAKNTRIEEQNRELSETNESLVQSQEKLNESFGAFRTITAEMISKAERELSQQDGMDSLRDLLTRKSLEIYEEVQQKWPDEPITNDIITRVWVSQLHRYGANLHRNRNELQPALVAYETSLAMLDEILAESPEDPYARGMTSETLRDYALTFARAGSIVEARKQMARALDLSSGMRAKFPDAPNTKRLHATNQADAAAIEIDEGQYETALAYANEAYSLIAPISEAANAKENDKIVTIFSLIWQATCRLDAGEMELATESIDKAIEECRSIVRKGGIRGFEHLLARSLLTKSNIMKANNMDDDAMEAASEAMQIWNELRKANPTFWSYTNFRTKAQLAIAVIDNQDQENKDSIESVLQVIEQLQELAMSRPSDYELMRLLCDAHLAIVQLRAEGGFREDAKSSLDELDQLIAVMQSLFPDSQAVETIKTKASELRHSLAVSNN